MEPHWTITELAAAAAAALGDEPVRVNGRVRDLPNERLIRWYTTIGLVDPPSGRRGRTALYGERHLLQLVAVKRRQAAGRTIAQIQTELLGATDTILREIAGLPARPRPTPPSPPAGRPDAPPRDARDARAPRPAAPAQRVPAPDADRSDPLLQTSRTPRTDTPPQGSATPDVSWSEAPAPRPDTSAQGSPVPDVSWSNVLDEGPGPQEEHGASGARGRFWAQVPSTGESGAAPPAHQGGLPAVRPVPVSGVRLAPGVTLLLESAALTQADLEAIGRAAEPLLAELRRRGLFSDPRLIDDPASPTDLNGRQP
ncbi:MerR HTH family regulatory protein [Thermomonospora echinospora]|uniref:MerR HTH family regulatory protein n=1 Tax=Thermomonospora echinospora TaxID=1992 RepID=A0A1H5YUA6_9ACTN|nr:MerR family transcriptional regulator [Thermomonospora echinospora]SEG27568.1 MerR HTH family regulatory protein [Thermomonospora echinospora]